MQEGRSAPLTDPRTAHSRPVQTSRRIPGSHWLAVKGPSLSRGRQSRPWLQPKIAMRRLRRGGSRGGAAVAGEGAGVSRMRRLDWSGFRPDGMGTTISAAVAARLLCVPGRPGLRQGRGPSLVSLLARANG
jgi:hypothetical protein